LLRVFDFLYYHNYDRLLFMKARVKICKFMSYILRHNPMGMKISYEGYMSVEDVLSLMQKRYPWLDKSILEERGGQKTP